MNASKNKFADSHSMTIRNARVILRIMRSMPTGSVGRFDDRGILHCKLHTHGDPILYEHSRQTQRVFPDHRSNKDVEDGTKHGGIQGEKASNHKAFWYALC
jgi:hypothetical protein